MSAEDRFYEAEIARIKADLEKLGATVKDDYLLVVVFEGHREYIDQRIKPLERLIYGLIGIVLSMVIASIMYLVIDNGTTNTHTPTPTPTTSSR